jgi:hypothetical protein
MEEQILLGTGISRYKYPLGPPVSTNLQNSQEQKALGFVNFSTSGGTVASPEAAPESASCAPGVGVGRGVSGGGTAIIGAPATGGSHLVKQRRKQEIFVYV